ncbi:MAG: type II toxin-antitoxin system VapB family antitoxin [Actinomycetota bacterium]|nr:type II toxin-antitoxin system VapB family antitoxin [Actinomycetota bacterium]
MGRTNVVVDDELLERAMKLYRLPTKRAAIDFALRRLVGDRRPEDMRKLRGIGWEGDLAELRHWEPPEI